jgi:hypothetical protein
MMTARLQTLLKNAINIHKYSLKFNITVIGKSTLFGKYAEGNYSMNLVDVSDTSKLILINGGCRSYGVVMD